MGTATYRIGKKIMASLRYTNRNADLVLNQLRTCRSIQIHLYRKHS
jgi:hypothetical protein